ncbi:MarR family winged helix-turn-helix transcriptional regulator [Streptomyces actuosus]|uniref:MarR family winged helix-turn-helix transcriptional regulator n=1 Tax=Streptomyces actuosus TaxID=1885 RepID=UPI0027DA80A3|nr:MarR family transcriptional regulator [Streptomyces actuosus]
MDDHVDGIVDAWVRERPDLDATPVQVFGRISRLSRQVENELAQVFERYGLDRGEFDTLATLRRAGAPYALSPSALMQATMITSGAATKRVARLERAGLVTRSRDRADGRGRRVRLTAKGMALIDQAVAEHLGTEARLLKGLSSTEAQHLASLLRKLGNTLI